MKQFIKQKLYERLVTEKLTDIDDDVDLIYNMYFKNDIEEIQNTGVARTTMFKSDKTNTSILKSKECVEADYKNRCEILINHGINYYNPFKKIISISINKNALNVIFNNNGNLIDAINYLPDEQKKMFKTEFTEEKIKGSIHHELTHWIDDTMHNEHIKNKISKANEFGNYNPDSDSMITSKIEIQGQIHNIKQLYNKYKDIWDKLTFKEMIELSSSLTSIYNKLDYDMKKQWLRDIKIRMDREGLLGKNMANT